MAVVADDLRADLDRLFVQARRSAIVGERIKLKPDGVGGQRAAGQPCPSNRAVAFLDRLFTGDSRRPKSKVAAALSQACRAGKTLLSLNFDFEFRFFPRGWVSVW